MRSLAFWPKVLLSRAHPILSIHPVHCPSSSNSYKHRPSSSNSSLRKPTLFICCCCMLSIVISVPASSQPDLPSFSISSHYPFATPLFTSLCRLHNSMKLIASSTVGCPHGTQMLPPLCHCKLQPSGKKAVDLLWQNHCSRYGAVITWWLMSAPWLDPFSDPCAHPRFGCLRARDSMYPPSGCA